VVAGTAKVSVSDNAIVDLRTVLAGRVIGVRIIEMSPFVAVGSHSSFIGYPNTDGLGLMEYMQWAEDLNAVSSFNFHYCCVLIIAVDCYPRRLGRPYVGKHERGRASGSAAAVYHGRDQRDPLPYRRVDDDLGSSARPIRSHRSLSSQVHRSVSGRDGFEGLSA
jgi:hypothetical protein